MLLLFELLGDFTKKFHEKLLEHIEVENWLNRLKTGHTGGSSWTTSNAGSLREKIDRFFTRSCQWRNLRRHLTDSISSRLCHSLLNHEPAHFEVVQS